MTSFYRRPPDGLYILPLQIK
ncbi:unnamed protein product [Lactuca saligna]|uniref:Uncharacterized protein n=1 Tax=Lactuca saligna TaxID=75948 RepID=A0AA35W069_LACSI|nr:unnamed protein product [Lactuca saligna]